MKKLFLSLFISLAFLFLFRNGSGYAIYAISSTPLESTSSAKTDEKDATDSALTDDKESTNAASKKETKELIDKVASKVSEMQKKNNIAVSGEITKITDKTIDITTKEEEQYSIKIDDALTKYFQITGVKKEESKLENIKKGDFIIVTGDINDKTITANFIYIDELYLVKSGNISEVNKTEYYCKVVGSDKEDYVLDIETFSKISILNIKTLELEKSGFSKIKEGDTIHFVVKKSGTEEKDKKANRYAAQKIIIIPQEFFIKQ